MADELRIEIKGLGELKAKFKELEGKVPREMAKGFKALAETVASKVRSQMPSKLAPTVKASGTQKGGAIKYASLKPVGPWKGNKNVTGWWDFGGIIGKQQSNVHPAVKGGRFLYPAISAEHENTKKALDELLAGLFKSVGLETRGHL